MVGVRLCFEAAFWTAIIGDGHMRPAANQLSVSATQKSGSLCVMMACVSVMTILSSVEYALLFSVRYLINSELSFVSVCVSVSDSGSSKFISVNVGIVSISGVGISKSKSVGNGNDVSSIFCVSDMLGTGVCWGALNADV